MIYASRTVKHGMLKRVNSDLPPWTSR